MTTFVTRDQWGARPRKRGTTDIINEPSVTYHYEGEGTVYPWDHSKCDDMVRSIQNYHMDVKEWSDIAYNYVVCPHDCCYEGRGYDRRSSANGNEVYNNLSFAVCALWGSKSGNVLPIGLKRAYMYARGILMSKGNATSKIYPHSHWHNTDCPGDPIRAWIAEGCPLPDIDGSKDFDMATINELKIALAQVFDQEVKDGQSLHELVQMYSAFNARNTGENKDLAVSGVDMVLKDDFKTISDQVTDNTEAINKMQGTLDSILQKLNQAS